MLKREYTPKRTVCKVTFKVPKDWAEDEVAVVGDFNDWDPNADKLELKNDYWETTLRLKPENTYHFRYYIDGERWANDEDADDYTENDYGSENSVLEIGA